MSASVDDMPMNTHERAKAANAALTTEQRSAAGKARAAALHSMLSLIDRACKKWPEATPEEKRAARAKLRAAGIIT